MIALAGMAFADTKRAVPFALESLEVSEGTVRFSGPDFSRLENLQTGQLRCLPTLWKEQYSGQNTAIQKKFHDLYGTNSRSADPLRQVIFSHGANLRRWETITVGSSILRFGLNGNQLLFIAVYARAFVLAGVGPGVSSTKAAFITPA